jgi:hypothetical protein
MAMLLGRLPYNLRGAAPADTCGTGDGDPGRHVRGAHRAGEVMILLASGQALLIGASLGLVGGGESILTLPAVVYAVGFTPRDAIVASLIVVGVAATAGADPWTIACARGRTRDDEAAPTSRPQSGREPDHARSQSEGAT